MSARESKVTTSSGNVFADLGFDDAEAQVLALRADLMAQREKQISDEGSAGFDTQ